MIKTDEDTLGGRIRKARMDKKLKMKELAEILQITANYLGLLERGKKSPSKKLLENIAENTGVSYAWLLNGPEDRSEEEISAPSPRCTVASVDLQLLLLTIMAKLSYDKELIAQFLGISTADVSRIIAGEDYDFDPSWDNVLSGLTQRMDLESLVEKFDMLANFFHEKRDEKNDWRLFTNLKQYIDRTSDTQYQLKGKIGYIEDLITYVYENITLYLYPKQAIFTSEADGNWRFNYYTRNRWLTPDADNIEALLQSQKVLPGDKLSIVLDDAELYDQSCICYKTFYDTCDIASDMMRIVSIILIDKDTMEILDIYTSDPDDPSPNEMSDTP